MPDNITQWRVFQDDLEIKKILELTDKLSTSLIEQDWDNEFDDNVTYSENSIADHKTVELKGNFIPKGLVLLEILFSKDDTLLNPTMQS